ncbi:hypothetical protein DPMN_057844 [Dreissena polymorpha]|uniref:Uncharacterized protein n=1 Tax=Dreissena polymorpha TaxID=45954 RepID=A0A9D4C110_DREPO|nr:hypothetical protein DPMN_057844 [Dreissena polymorpha]
MCKDNFYLLSTLPFEEGFKCVNWSFMEAGHGKGAPDEIGAVIKRAADGVVLHGEDIVNAVSMYDTLTKKSIAPHLFLITDGQFEEQKKLHLKIYRR